MEQEVVDSRLKTQHKSVSMLCNEGLDHLGNQASTAEVKAYILSRYPGITLNDNTLSTTLSQTRSKRNGNYGSRKRGQSSEPSLHDLLTVKQLAEKGEGVEALAEQVGHLVQLAEKVGGLDNLNRCMEALRQLKYT